MARRRSSLRYPSGRNLVIPPIASRRLPQRISVRSAQQLILDNARLYGHDNRAYSPIPRMIRPARHVTGRIAATTVPRNAPLRKVRYQFSLPSSVVVCVRRGVRKEVIFAKNKAGRNGQRKSRRTSSSHISCKRRR